MKPSRKKLLYATLAASGALAADAANAVQLSTDNRGQVLLFPYYTTRADGAGNAYATLASVVNTTNSAKAVRVRFLEGRNSREVLDFNLFLSPFDVWTFALLPDLATGGAKIGTTDFSCTLPAFSTSPTAPFVSFVNMAYSGINDDGGGTTLDRSQEGYFEIIEMATYTSQSVTGKAVTHVNGVPSCGMNLSEGQPAADAQPPRGGLMGASTFINVGSGTDYSADPVALANFYQVGANYQPLGSALPDLTQASPPLSTVLAPDGRLYESLWSAGTADAVSAVLMHDSVMNDYVLDTATLSQTDWVVTMPTKRFYARTGTGNAPKLFQRNFNGTRGSCDDLSLNIFDREEHTTPPPFNIGLPPPSIPYALCATASVVTFVRSNSITATGVTTSGVFGSRNITAIPTQLDFFTTLQPAQNGWLKAGFPTRLPGASSAVHMLFNVDGTTVSGGGQMLTGASATYFGLPVIGFAAMSFTNGTLVVGSPPVNVLSNYGGNFAHRTSTTIQPSVLSVAGPTGCVATINGQSSVVLPSSGGSLNLAVTGCNSPSPTPLSYSWSFDGRFLTIGESVQFVDGPNATATPITRTFRVRVCTGIDCNDFPATPLTSTVAAGASGGS